MEKVCGVRPRYSDGKKTYSYCGKRCAMKARNNAGLKRRATVSNMAAANTASATPPGKSSAIAVVTSFEISCTGPTCAIPGCTKPVHKDANGTTSEYCSKTHKR